MGAAMVESQDLRSGAHSDTRFENSNRETFPSTVRICGNQSNKTFDSETKWQSIETIEAHCLSSSATAEDQMTKTSRSLVRMVPFWSLAWREYPSCGTLWFGSIFHHVYSFFVTVWRSFLGSYAIVGITLKGTWTAYWGPRMSNAWGVILPNGIW